ncbi:hypothetical protein EJ02DRAFT_66271 [Clathrospora elynae]|uniref:Uncharacterized protein n=1 Tax=Clathrospora elynae TaxID=706981 RepID=A0A6A5T045_9PLEO|nr:hypothetical protein EJ02DRAFT_66271 [Clathrospora elynae]
MWEFPMLTNDGRCMASSSYWPATSEPRLIGCTQRHDPGRYFTSPTASFTHAMTGSVASACHPRVSPMRRESQASLVHNGLPSNVCHSKLSIGLGVEHGEMRDVLTMGTRALYMLANMSHVANILQATVPHVANIL